jgi:hypothetical protein
LPTGNALNAAKWREYNDAIAKWNACRANQGLATVTPTQPPPTPTPTPVPPPTTYAQAACEGWEIGVCQLPQKLPSDQKVESIVNGFLTLTVGPGKDIASSQIDEYIDFARLKKNIVEILLISQEYGLSDREVAYALATAFGESRLGGFKSGFYKNSMWENISASQANTYYDLNGDGKRNPAHEQPVQYTASDGTITTGYEGYQGYIGNDEPGDGFRYRGRGYIMLTFKNNYRTMADHFDPIYGVDILNDPDVVATNTKLAAEMMVWGMLNGIMTTHGFRSPEVLTNGELDFGKARKIINGYTASDNVYIDRANVFLEAIQSGIL